MTEEKKEPTVSINFKWLTVSPDPTNVVMRNNLEPVNLFVRLELPLKNEYIANSEKLIKAQLDVDSKGIPDPILTPEGVRYCVAELSLAETFTPEEEDFSDEEWGEDSDPEFDNDNGDYDWEEE